MLAQEFVKPNVLYFNTGSFSLTPKSVLNSQKQYLEEFELNPTLNLFQSWGKMWEAQKAAAELLNVNPKDLFLRPNVTGSLNDFIMGVKLAAGDIAVTDLEYGAIVNICKLRCKKEDRKLRVINIPLETQIQDRQQLIEKIVQQLDSKVRLLVISHVTTGTGLKIPIEALAKALKGKNLVLAVDGAQGAGGFEVGFDRRNDIHFYGGNFHKWFLGPKGTGFGWVPDWFQEEVDSIQGSWTTFETVEPFTQFGDGSRFAQRMLHSSCLTFSTFYSLIQLNTWWQTHQPQKIYLQLNQLRNKMEETALSEGWKILSAQAPELKSPLLALELPEKYQQYGLQLLYKLAHTQQVQVALPFVRGRHVLRLSAHVYNDHQEIQELFNKLRCLKL